MQIISSTVRYIIDYYSYFVKYHQIGKECLRVLVNLITYVKIKAAYAHNIGMHQGFDFLVKCMNWKCKTRNRIQQ